VPEVATVEVTVPVLPMAIEGGAVREREQVESSLPPPPPSLQLI
jgi:hypothetical protein